MSQRLRLWPFLILWCSARSGDGRPGSLRGRGGHAIKRSPPSLRSGAASWTALDRSRTGRCPA